MKSIYKYLLLAASICLTSCQIDEICSYNNVKVVASISDDTATRVSDDGTYFTDGDMIQVVNTSRTSNNTAVFAYNKGDNSWTTEDILLWESNVKNTFCAWYPVSASYESYTIPTDQSSGLGGIDWMTATAYASASEGKVELLFNHHLTKVNIEIDSWRSEFLNSEQEIFSLSILTPSSVVTNDGTTILGNKLSAFVNTYVNALDQSYSALIAPGSYDKGTEIIKLQVGGQTLSVQTADVMTLVAGKAYKFRLNVGKDVIVLSQDNVSVVDWNDVDLDNAVFEDAVFQLAENTPTEYQLSYGSSILSIPLIRNLGFDVSITYNESESNWITYVDEQTKSTEAQEFTLKIGANKSTTTRQATITLHSNILNKSIDINVSQTPFTGLDDSNLDKNKYITFVEDYEYEGYGDAFDYNMYDYGTTIYNSGFARSSKVEYKFSLNDFTKGNFYITVDDYDDSIYSLYLNEKGLNFNTTCYLWEDLGVNKTDIITLAFKGTTMTINGKTIENTPSFYRYFCGYLWSGHYHERDDGMWWNDYTFQDGGRIYYAKGWDADNKLIYIGRGALSSDGRVCWKSEYYDNYSGELVITENFPRVTESFGKGNL